MATERGSLAWANLGWSLPLGALCFGASFLVVGCAVDDRDLSTTANDPDASLVDGSKATPGARGDSGGDAGVNGRESGSQPRPATDGAATDSDASTVTTPPGNPSGGDASPGTNPGPPDSAVSGDSTLRDAGPPDMVDAEEAACTTGATRSCRDDLSLHPLGNCALGTERCANGVWGACSVTRQASDTCTDGDDANCNGTANEGCACLQGASRACGMTIGICRSGTQSCSNGAWGPCGGTLVTAKPRDCSSSADNDCDGRPDSTIDTVCRCAANAVQACNQHAGFDGKGPCRAGSQSCVMASDRASSNWGACSGGVAPAASDSCDVARDDANCNGVVNDGCQCVRGASRACGQCNEGTQLCQDGRLGIYSVCNGTISKTYYRDADNDTFGDPKVTTTGCAPPGGYVTNSTDCCDKDAHAKPGATAWSATPTACGGFDFNCDGVESMRNNYAADPSGYICYWDGSPPQVAQLPNCGESSNRCCSPIEGGELICPMFQQTCR